MVLAGTIDMQDMRQLNLFRKITGVSTKHILDYNNMKIFCVPKKMLSKAIGKNARNLKKINSIIGKRIRVVPIPKGIQHAKNFIQAIVKPVKFNDIKIKDDEIILVAGRRNKAALIGRNKRRLKEMQKIIDDFFGREFKIV